MIEKLAASRTHQAMSLLIADKRVVAVGTIDELLALDHPWIQEYFNGPRGRAAEQSAQHAEAGGREPLSPREATRLTGSDEEA